MSYLFLTTTFAAVSSLINIWCSVPLDYFNSTAGVAKIALGRYNATASPRKGSVFINPGGPGGTGVSFATVIGAQLQQVVSSYARGFVI